MSRHIADGNAKLSYKKAITLVQLLIRAKYEAVRLGLKPVTVPSLLMSKSSRGTTA